MIKKIYSKLDPSLLLHIIHFNKESKAVEGITDPAHFLQAMTFSFPVGYEGKRHKHNYQKRETTHTHEALLVFEGSIELSIYDTDNSLVEKVLLGAGDCYVIINGGHSIKTLKPSKVFEFKNGPYTGPENDKTLF